MKSSSKTLLWLIHEGNSSGANMALLEYFEILKDLNFKLRVISPGEGSFTRQLRDLQFSVAIVPFYPWTRRLDQGYFVKDWFRRFLRNVYASWKIRNLAKGVEAICTNTICTQLGLVVTLFLKKKHFLFVHEFGEEDHGFKLAIPTSKAYHFFYSYSDKVVLNSQAVKSKWEVLVGDQKKLSVLYNCVNIPKETVFSENRVKPIQNKFLMLGQISAAKGHQIAIEAVNVLAEKYKNIALDIVGSTISKTYCQELEMMAKHSQATITLKPPISNPFSIFPEYTALLMCSRKEAFGRVTVEALKSGLPVIALNSGGTSEIVEDGVNGFLVNPDKMEDLVKKLEAIIQMEEEKYLQLSNNAKQISKKFNQEVSKMQLVEIFKTFL